MTQSIYDALVRLVQDWSLRYPLVAGPGQLRLPGRRPGRRAAVHRVPDGAARHGDGARHPRGDRRLPPQLRRQDAASPTCCRAASPTCSSTAAPASRSAWPPRSRRTTCARSPTRPSGCSPTPRPSREEVLEAVVARDQGTGLPHRRADHGPQGASRTPTAPVAARSSCARSSRSRRSRAGSASSSPSCPTRSTPTRLAQKIAELTSRTAGSPASPTSATRPPGRTGQRLVIVLKRDAVAKVVLNNLYKHTQLQTNFGANMLALVDGVPRTLPIDAFIRHWVDHQIEVIQRRTTYRLRKAEERDPHPARSAQGPRRARRGHRPDPPLADRRGGPRRADRAARDRRDPGPRHPRHAAAPPRGPRAPEDHRRARRARGDDPRLHQDILAKPERQRDIVSEELAEIVDKYGDDRRTKIDVLRRRHVDGGPDPRGGRRRHDHPRRLRQAHPGRRLPLAGPRRQGRARRARCAATTWSTTSSPPPRTTGCSSSPTSAGSTAPRPTSCPTPAATPRASTSPTCMAFQPDEQIAQVLDVRDYAEHALPRARHEGRPGQEDPARRVRLARAAVGLIAVNLRDGDELVGGRPGRRRPTTCCSSRARASRCASTPTDASCARWAAPPPA